MIPLYCSVVLSNDLFPWMPTSKSVAICFASSPLTASIANSYRQLHDTSWQKKLLHLQKGVFLLQWQGGEGAGRLQTPDSQGPSHIPFTKRPQHMVNWRRSDRTVNGQTTKFGTNCWSNSRLQSFVTSALASFSDTNSGPQCHCIWSLML